MSVDVQKLTEALIARIKEERDDIASNPNEFSKRRLADIDGFQDQFSYLAYPMLSSQEFQLLDTTIKSREYKLDIGTESADVEYDLFDAIRVSPEVPFAVLNLNKKKLPNIRVTYISTDRRFKLYHSKDVSNAHDDFIDQWSKDLKLSSPHTLIIKVINPAMQYEKISDKTYINVIYRFGEGLFISLKSDSTPDDLAKIVDIMQRHIIGFKLTLGQSISETSSFVVDNIVVDPALFRGTLMMPWSTPNTTSSNAFSPIAYLWVVEKDKPLSLRPHFLLNFKLGNLKAKIQISKKYAKRNDVFYKNGTPFKMNEDVEYNVVSLTGATSKEDTEVLKVYVGSMFYRYGQVYLNPQTQRATTASVDFSTYINVFLTRPKFSGGAFVGSSRITADDLKDMQKNITKLKAIDPSFWGSMPTVKKISHTARQPIPIVSTSTADWQQILWGYVTETFSDPAGYNRQIIRYPFVVKDDSYPIIPGVEPYFMICPQGWPFIQLKPNDYPELSGQGSYHPYIVACSGKKFITTPGQTPEQIYDALRDLSTPFVIERVAGVVSKSKYIETTIKILEHSKFGVAPATVNKVFNSILRTTISSLPQQDQISYLRIGSPPNMDSLLHCLVTESVSVERQRNEYMSLAENFRAAYLSGKLKTEIAEFVNWNIARQEYFEKEGHAIKSEFLNQTDYVDSRLFRRILEEFFNVHLVIIKYTKGKSSIEIPRHKFYYIRPSYKANTQVIVLFKHEISRKNGQKKHYYEVIKMYDARNSVVPWKINEFVPLFDHMINKTVDISFHNIHRVSEDIFDSGISVTRLTASKWMLTDIFNRRDIKYQYIDGAGKTRMFGYKFGSAVLSIACEPLAPVSVETVDDTRRLQKPGYNPIQYMAPNLFEDALQLIQRLEIPQTDIAYKVSEDDETLASGIWFKYRNIQFYLATELGTPLTYPFPVNNDAYYEIDPERVLFKQHDQYERIMNILIQLTRNLFVKSTQYFNPQTFMDNMVVIEPEHVYDIVGARRRIGPVENYPVVYPSFFTHPDQSGNVKLIVDSRKTWRGLKQHLDSLAILRFNILKSAGIPQEEWAYYNALDLPRYPEFYNRPNYIEEFYAYASDFAVRGPDQRVFMSESETRMYIQYLTMEETSPVISFPVPVVNQLTRIPIYYVSSSGDVYVLQNVEGGSEKRAMNVLQTWKTDKINLGFYSDELEDLSSIKPTRLFVDDLHKLASSDRYVIVSYDSDRFSALFKL